MLTRQESEASRLVDFYRQTRLQNGQNIGEIIVELKGVDGSVDAQKSVSFGDLESMKAFIERLMELGVEYSQVDSQRLTT